MDYGLLFAYSNLEDGGARQWATQQRVSVPTTTQTPTFIIGRLTKRETRQTEATLNKKKASHLFLYALPFLLKLFLLLRVTTFNYIHTYAYRMDL